MLYVIPPFRNGFECKGGKDLVNTKAFTNPIGYTAEAIKTTVKSPVQGLTMLAAPGLGRGLMPDVANGYIGAMADPNNKQYKYDSKKGYGEVGGKLLAPSTSRDGMSSTDYYRKQTFSPAEYSKWQQYQQARAKATGTLMQ